MAGTTRDNLVMGFAAKTYNMYAICHALLKNTATYVWCWGGSQGCFMAVCGILLSAIWKRAWWLWITPVSNSDIIVQVEEFCANFAIHKITNYEITKG